MVLSFDEEDGLDLMISIGNLRFLKHAFLADKLGAIIKAGKSRCYLSEFLGY